MAKPETTLAVVMRRSDFRETSRIVTLLTRSYGMQGFLAKGAHRPGSPFLGAIDLLHVVEAKVGIREGRGLQNLYSARLRIGNRPFRHDRPRRLLAYRLAEILRIAMPEGRADPHLFDLFQGGLQLLARSRQDRLGTIFSSLGLKILDHLGLLPSLTLCPTSGKPLPVQGQIGFDPAQGGFVAPDQARRQVAAELPALALHLSRLPGRELGVTDLKGPLPAELHTLVQELLIHRLDYEPRIPLPAGLFAPGTGTGAAESLAFRRGRPRIRP